MRAILLLLFTLFCSFSLRAQTVANIEIPETIPLISQSNTPTHLVLNGAGIRTKFIYDIYIGALYLEKKQETANAVYAAPGAKKVHMHFLYDELPKKKLVEGWTNGFNNNHSEDELLKIRDRIVQFNNLFSSVKKGDVIDITFIPAKGTSVVKNGKIIGVIQGDDFFTAILKIWIGAEPADLDLKEAMLGKLE